MIALPSVKTDFNLNDNTWSENGFPSWTHNLEEKKNGLLCFVYIIGLHAVQLRKYWMP